MKGEGNQQDYGMRIYDARIGKFLSVDPITKQYPELTPYQFASNSPIDAVDLDGLERSPAGKFGQYNEIVRDNTAVQLYPNAIPVIQKQKQDAPKLRMLRDFSSRLPETLEDAGKAAFRSNLSNADNIGGQAAFGIYQNIHDAKKEYGEGNWGMGTVYLLNGGINTVTLTGVGPALGVNGKVGVKAEPLTVVKSDFKSISELGLRDGMKVTAREALELGENFLGKGYTEPVSGSGRYVSKDGERVFRMGTTDITGAHGGGPHVNFETLVPNPSKPGKMKVDKNIHVYLNDKK